MLFGVEPHVHDLRQVDVDVGVLGLELEPTLRARVGECLLEGVMRLLGHAHGQHLAALEADVYASGRISHQWPSGASTSSVSTPPVDFGCRNATRLPPMPLRGCSSISCRPAPRTASRADSMSSMP